MSQSIRRNLPCGALKADKKNDSYIVQFLISMLAYVDRNELHEVFEEMPRVLISKFGNFYNGL